MRKYNTKGLYPKKKVLSSSQFLQYERDVQEFYLRYIMGVKKEPGKAMQIGRIFSEMYADRKFDPTEELLKAKAPSRLIDWFEEVINRFPVVPKRYCEYELKCRFKGWGFRATLDGFVLKQDTIIENKAGLEIDEDTKEIIRRKGGIIAGITDQEKADRSDQITFQNWVFWKKYKRVAKKTIVNWVDTGPKQRLLSFKTHRSKEMLEYFEQRVVKVIENLEAKNFTKNLYE